MPIELLFKYNFRFAIMYDFPFPFKPNSQYVFSPHLAPPPHLDRSVIGPQATLLLTFRQTGS